MLTVLESSYLKKPGQVLALSMLVLATVVFAYDYLISREQEQLMEAERQLMELRRERREQLDSQSIYSQYADQYERYREIGYIGPEDRLSWLEALRASNDELKLNGLNYHVTPRIESEQVATKKPISVYESSMIIDMNALHEGDVLTLLSVLEKRAQGYFRVDNCALESLRDADQRNLDARYAQLGVHCELTWFSVIGEEA